MSQAWNRVWPPGAGEYGWKLDVEKEIPYYPLEFSGVKHLLGAGVTPLRVEKRLANSLPWSIYNAHSSAVEWATRKKWNKPRQETEAKTLARILDLGFIEFGNGVVERCACFEVLIRRLHANVTAVKDGKWDMANLLEEVPGEKTPDLHPVIIKDLTTAAKLYKENRSAATGNTAAAKDEGTVGSAGQFSACFVGPGAMLH